MSRFDDRLKDYVDVKERIRLFYERHPDGRLVTAEVIPSAEPDDRPRVWVHAKAYRTPDDPQPGDGWSWLELPGATPYTKGSEIENAETSAWGRAIGSLGIGIAASIASRDEVQSKAEDVTEDAKRMASPPVEDGTTLDLIGNVEVRKPPADLELRQTPDGYAFGFGLVADGKGGRVQVIAEGDLAAAIHDAGLTEGERVQVWGRIELVEWTPQGAKSPRQFKRLHLTKIRTPDYELPAQPDTVSAPIWPEDAA